MGRRKKETFYQLLQRRIREHNEADQANDAKATAAAEPEKGTGNARHCRTYRNRHPDKVKNATQKWLENFKKEHGMGYSTYYYRKKHGLL